MDLKLVKVTTSILSGMIANFKNVSSRSIAVFPAAEQLRKWRLP
jgi:hypothetical protein